MADTLIGKSVITLTDTYTKTGTLANVEQAITIAKTQAWADGANANQAQQVFVAVGSLNGTTALDLDCTALVSEMGTISLTKVKEVYLEVTTLTSGAKLQLGGDANSVPIFGAAADFIEVQAGGWIALGAPVDGYTVTNATGDIIQLYNPGGTAVAYKIMIKGLGTLA